jgi:pimeloyl-ACP methyl ester carboxylesterase
MLPLEDGFPDQARLPPVNALERSPAGGPGLLCLHGWLDHAHSFDWMRSALPADCADLIGHSLGSSVAWEAFRESSTRDIVS